MENTTYTINLPDNKIANNISTKVENGQIIVNCDLNDNIVFNEGEIYFVEPDSENNFIIIGKSFENGILYSYATLFIRSNSMFINSKDRCCMAVKNIREATTQEKEKLFSELTKRGKTWNAEKMRVEDIFDPKDGDFLVSSNDGVFIYKPNYDYPKVCGCYCGTLVSGHVTYLSFDRWTTIEGCRYATKAEKQIFLEKLKKEGYMWNKKKKCVEKYRWTPKYGEEYYFINEYLFVEMAIMYSFNSDMMKIEAHNCFKTEDEAKNKAEELKSILIK